MSTSVSGTMPPEADYLYSDRSGTVSVGLNGAVTPGHTDTNRDIEIAVFNRLDEQGRDAGQRIEVAVPKALSGYSDSQLMAAINEGMAALAETNVLRRKVNRELYFVQADSVADQQESAAKEERKGARLGFILAMSGIGATIGFGGGALGFTMWKNGKMKKVQVEKKDLKEIGSWLREIDQDGPKDLGRTSPLGNSQTKADENLLKELNEALGGKSLAEKKAVINEFNSNIEKVPESRRARLDDNGNPVIEKYDQIERVEALKDLIKNGSDDRAKAAGFHQDQIEKIKTLQKKNPKTFKGFDGEQLTPGSRFAEMLDSAKRPAIAARNKDIAHEEMLAAEQKLNEVKGATPQDTVQIADAKADFDHKKKTYNTAIDRYVEAKENDLLFQKQGGAPESLGDKLRDLGTKDIYAQAWFNLASVPGGTLNSLAQSLPVMNHTAHAKELDALATRDSAQQNFINDNTGLVTSEIAAFLRTIESIKDLNLSVGGAVAQGIKA
ncbi:MAG: hypothetical protein P8176_04885 [Gammaproteobacteria bacterium]